jgi:lysophospholipase L1-like esterase
MNNRKTIIYVIYFVGLHVFIFISLLRPDLLLWFSFKVGIYKSHTELSEYYSTMVTTQLRVDGCVPNGSILFFGDSITQGLCVNAITEKGINFGIGRDSTSSLANRIGKYKSIRKASAIVITIGTNDIRTLSDEDILTSYRLILSELPNNIPIIINAIFPVGASIKKENLKAKITKLNIELKKLSSFMKNSYFMNTGLKMIDHNGNLKSEYHIGDGIHLNSAGYGIWIDDLKVILHGVVR